MITLNNGTTAGDGTGDILFDIFDDIKANFSELNLRQVTSTADPTATDDGADGYQAFKTLWLNSRTRNLFILTDATTSAAVWQCLNRDRIILATNEIYAPFTDMFGTTGACAANLLRVVMFKPAQRMTVDQMGMLVNTAGAVNFKAGLWATSGNTATGTPLATIASTSANANQPIANLSAAVTLDPALWYAFGEVHDGTLDKVTHQTIMNKFAGADVASRLANGSSNRGWHYSLTHTFANALPDLTGALGTTQRVNGSVGGAGPGAPIFRVSNVSPT